MGRLFSAVSLCTVLGTACAGEVPDTACVSDADAGDMGPGAARVAPHVAPSESRLCAIEYGSAGRDQVEQELGPPDSTRETLDRVVMQYVYEDGVRLLLHLDADVFRDFSVYGARVPQCWADAKRRATQRPANSDAGPDSDDDS